MLAIYAAPDRAALEVTLLTHPQSEALAWDGAGHWLHQERPDEFNRLVDSWIASLGAPATT